MNRKLLLSLAGACAATMIAFGAAQAAPASSTVDSLKAIGQAQSTTQDVRWHRHCYNRCHWHHGHRHCRRVCTRRWW
jgi:hypothetical protein